MEYRNFDIDFAKRTWANLEYIRRKRKETDDCQSVYEVTQLINSFLGLLVFPYEAHQKKGAVKLSISESLLKEINKCPNKEDTYQETTDYEKGSFEELQYHLRNAISHKRIYCYSENGFISSLSFEDRKRNERYKIELSLLQVEQLVEELYRSIAGTNK